ncbi:unnamed protein product [Protopolystoma xenopodis]|uniref:Uncharacterized protein n=1 Tax=Protopolystoma xenopodis TaxID=117903 RepID=A0A448WNH5_9PLAT|nr:unnamed protein product [Protopolystoma xenopodis]
MLPCSNDVRHMTDESLTPFHRNPRRLPRKQRQHEPSSKANRQLVKSNPPSSPVEPTSKSLHPTLSLEVEVSSTILKQEIPRNPLFLRKDTLPGFDSRCGYG